MCIKVQNNVSLITLMYDIPAQYDLDFDICCQNHNFMARINS